MLHAMFEHMAPLIVTFTPCIRAFTTKSSSLSTDVYYLLRLFFSSTRGMQGCEKTESKRGSRDLVQKNYYRAKPKCVCAFSNAL